MTPIYTRLLTDWTVSSCMSQSRTVLGSPLKHQYTVVSVRCGRVRGQQNASDAHPQHWCGAYISDETCQEARHDFCPGSAPDTLWLCSVLLHVPPTSTLGHLSHPHEAAAPSLACGNNQLRLLLHDQHTTTKIIRATWSGAGRSSSTHSSSFC